LNFLFINKDFLIVFIIKMNNKKKCELFYLKKFLEFQEINPIDVFPSESPDFILELPDKKIGIELTEYHSELNTCQRDGSTDSI